MLIAVERLPSREGVSQKKVQWLVRCDCGGEAKVDAGDLTRRDGRGRKSCGCRNHVKGKNSPHWKSPNIISSTYWSATKQSAKARSLEFDIDIDYAFSLFDGRCALSGAEIVIGINASIDRIDSQLGYIRGNIQWVDWKINKMKSNMKQDEFIILCRLVGEYCGR